MKGKRDHGKSSFPHPIIQPSPRFHSKANKQKSTPNLQTLEKFQKAAIKLSTTHLPIKQLT